MPFRSTAFTPVSIGLGDLHPYILGLEETMITIFTITPSDVPFGPEDMPPTLKTLRDNHAQAIQRSLILAIRLVQQALPDTELRFLVQGDRPELARGSGVRPACLLCGMKKDDFTQHWLYGPLAFLTPRNVAVDRKSVVEGKRVDLGGRRYIKKKNK